MAKKIRNAVRTLNAQFIAAVANPPAYTADVAAAEVDTQTVQEQTQDDKESVQQDDDALYTLTDDEARNAFGIAQPDDNATQSDNTSDNVQSDDTQDAPVDTNDNAQQDDTQQQSDDKQDTQPEIPAATAPVKLTKKLQVRNFIAATPASVATIATHMGISNIAAQSLIGDLKRDRVQVVSKKVDKVTLYTVAA